VTQLSIIVSIIVATVLGLELPADFRTDAPICKTRSADRSYFELDIGDLRKQSLQAEGAERRYILYRLFPLSNSSDDLEILESKLEEGSAEDFAVMSALWAFRSQDANPFNWIRYIRRSEGFLKRAIEIDANDPMVALIESQALFYKPGFAGGGKEKALNRLLDLRERIQNSESCAEFLVEVDPKPLEKNFSVDQSAKSIRPFLNPDDVLATSSSCCYLRPFCS